jgi:ElaB/YqjD/DUF883 family membrane-anchored ribosome-binding protein
MGKSSSNAATTNNTDKRLVTGEGSLGVSADNSSVTLNMLDGGIVSEALKTVQISDAISADGFGKLLNVAESLFNQGQNLIGQTQSAVAQAYSQAQTDAKSTIDNRTVIVLGVAAAAVGIFALRKK